MSSKTIEQITNHLEFLGFKIERTEPQKQEDKEFFLARHPTHNNLFYLEGTPNFIFFQISLNCERGQSAEMNHYINQYNSITNIAKAYCVPQSDTQCVIRIEATYTGEYIKEMFGQFYDLLDNDQRRFGSLENFNKIFIKP